MGDKKIFTRRRITGIFYLVGAVITAVLTLFTEGNNERALSIISLICDGAALCYIFINDGIGKKIKGGVESIFSTMKKAIIRFAKKLAEKFSMSTGRAFRGKGFIRAYDELHERVGARDSQMRKKKKRKKYKDMDNAEKIRYMYEKKVNGAIKKGVPLNETMTPIEVGDTMVEDGYMKENGSVLIDTYNMARYDDLASISKEQVERAKTI